MGLLAFSISIIRILWVETLRIWLGLSFANSNFLGSSHINLVLISKKEKVKKLEDLRPINFCNFVNKIFSRIILERLSAVVLKVISKNQSGSVKGRNIAKNILLA